MSEARPLGPTTLVVDAPAPPAEPAPPPPPPARPPALRLFLGGLGSVLRAPRAWVFVLGVELLLALGVAAQAYEAAREHWAPLARADLEPGTDFLNRMPRWLFEDLARARPGEAGAWSWSLAAAALLSSLLGLVFAAGWMNLGLHRARHGLAAFLQTGGRFLPAFFLTWILGLPLAWAATWLVQGPPGEAVLGWFFPEGDPSLAAHEGLAWWVLQVREVLAVFLLLLVEIALDLGRAGLVVRGRGTGILAVPWGLAFLLRHPLRSLAVCAAGLALEGLWLLAFGFLLGGAETPASGLGLLVLLLSGRILLRGARLAGLALLVESHLTGPDEAPLEPGDPWATG